MIFIKKTKKEERGVVLYVTLLVLSSLIAMATAIASIMIGEFKISGDIARSMYAVNSAGSGLEATLYKLRIEEASLNANETCVSVGLTSSNCVISIDAGFNTESPCNGAYNCTKVQSTGTNGGFNRKLQAVYQNR